MKIVFRLNNYKIVNLSLGLVWFLINGCFCNKGASCSQCPCERIVKTISADKVLIEALANTRNRESVFRSSKSGKYDTLRFGDLVYEIDTGTGKCRRPRQTCCDIVYSDNYKLPYKNEKYRSYFNIDGFSGGRLWTIGGTAFSGKDTLRSIRFDRVQFNDILVSRTGNDTTGLLSVSRGLLLYMDSDSVLWKRIL